MKTYPQCLEEKRLTARAIALHDRLARLDAQHDAELTAAKEYETATLMFIIDLLRSGPSLTVHGKRYVDQQLTEHEHWLDDVSIGDEPDLQSATARPSFLESGVSGPSEDAASPIVVVTVVRGMVTEVNATSPVTVFVEDRDGPLGTVLVEEFASRSLTPEQEKRVQNLLAESEEVPRPKQN